MKPAPWFVVSVTVLAAMGACSSGESGSGGGTPTSSSSTQGAGAATGTGSSSSATTGTGGSSPGPKVFLILMENHNWSDILGSASAPYINGTLLAAGAHADQYFNPPGIHPSLPNYLWLEAGKNFGIQDDFDPSFNSQTTTQHLVTQLEAAGYEWRSYQENIDGKTCPLKASPDFQYYPKHNPMVFFEDVTNGNKASSARCIEHVRPFTELIDPNDPTKGDLAEDRLKNYNFITPNICNDMHDTCGGDEIAHGDAWLQTNVEILRSSKAYADGAMIFVTWDEGEGSDGPIGMMVLGKNVTPGASTTTHYDHSSTLKTIQEIFGLSPLLGAAADPTTNDLSDLFVTFP